MQQIGHKNSLLTIVGILEKSRKLVCWADFNLLGEDELIENEYAKTIGKIAEAMAWRQAFCQTLAQNKPTDISLVVQGFRIFML